MIVLDTNVISEILRALPDRRVGQWVEAQRLEDLHTTSVCEAELRLGIALLPEGRRRADLAVSLELFLRRAFSARILGFDSAAAPHYAAIVSRRRGAGRPIDQSDAQIAAICRHHRAAIATRDVAGFEGLDIAIVNPWLERSTL